MSNITKYLRFGEEADYAVETTDYAETVDPSSAGFDPAGSDKLIHEGIVGLDKTAGLGVYTVNGDFEIPLDDSATGWLWKWALGGYSVTGEAGSFTHSFVPKLGGLMDSFTAAVGKDEFEHVFLGNVISEISIAADNEWAMLSVSTVGSKDERGTLQETLDFTEGRQYTAPDGALLNGETDLSADVNSVSVAISTGADVAQSAGFGSRFPTKGVRGSLEVTMEAELVFDSLTQLETFWGGTNGPSTDTITEEEYTLSFGDALDISIPRAVVTSSGQPADGRGTITQSISMRGLYDPATDSGPVGVHLTNARESYEITP